VVDDNLGVWILGDVEATYSSKVAFKLFIFEFRREKVLVS